jgi:subtilase family serine protease
MTRNITFRLYALPFLAGSIAIAQPQDRLPMHLEGRGTAPVHGTRNPRITSAEDDGPVADDDRIYGIQLRFKPSAAQSAALTRLLEDQQNPNSPRYHAWLTPEEFGKGFGLSAKDLSGVQDWLKRQGFLIDGVARSRTFITFSATAGQIRDTFHTEIHRYRAAGRAHFASAREAEVPVDLTPLLFTITGLDDFGFENPPALKPALNRSGGQHSLAPGDLATIYNLIPALERGLNGTGQKIAIAGRADIHMEDVQNFRSQFGLPKNDPQRILVPGYPNPGNDEDTEYLLDLEIAGAIAPNATLIYVFAPNAWSGVLYAIDENVAPILSTSFGGCETNSFLLGTIDLLRFLGQQANAQGITWVSGSGDSGAAACESQLTDSAGVHGMEVFLPASLPEVTGIGGTQFAEGGGTYWNADGAALSYIPEVAWNDTALTGKLTATGGGASIFFPRPSWQKAVGVPNDNARHVPDIAFAASPNHDGYQTVMHGAQRTIGGTSAGGPFFAGVLALLNQQLESNGTNDKPGLGNINPKLYQLAETAPGVFHDITSGDNIVPCRAGTPDCGSSHQYGYKAAAGYDHVTGLGSIDVDKLLRSWVQ